MDAVALGEGAARALPSLERGAVQHAQVASTAARKPGQPLGARSLWLISWLVPALLVLVWELAARSG